MTTYRKDLKMYVRYDKLLGRIIPSNNILSRVKPKVGNWTEISAEECCSGCVPIYVCNAGTVGANGLYTCAGMVNNRPFYTKDGGYRLSWGEYPMFDEDFYDEWDIWDMYMNCLYFSGGDDNTPTPNLAEYWISEDGNNPAPTVQLEECDPYSCLCYSVLTVGGNGRSIWGYLIESYGSLTPNCSSIIGLVYFVGEGSALILVSNEDLKDCIVVTIDGTDYNLQYSWQGPYGYEYVLLNGENPFPELGETCIIVVDCDVDCPTTTTTTTGECGEYMVTVLDQEVTDISYIDCEGQPQVYHLLEGPEQLTLCAMGSTVELNGDGEVTLLGECCRCNTYQLEVADTTVMLSYYDCDEVITETEITGPTVYTFCAMSGNIDISLDTASLTSTGCNCTTTTTSTTACVPEGEYLNTFPFASSYTPTQGVPTPFINSGADACEAILIVAGDGGTFDYFDVDSYSYGDVNHYYLAGTCTPLPTGYYVFDMEGDIFGCHVTAGEMDEYDICTTTTTTTVAPTTTTTTTVG